MTNPHQNTLIGKINSRYVNICNKVTDAYTKKYGLICDVYYPINNAEANEYGTYEDVDIFNRRQSASYNEEPNADLVGVKFTFVGLFKAEGMNSPSDEFDAFYLSDDDRRPFIECQHNRQLPVMSKIVVYVANSVFRFYIDRQTVVNGANGHLIMRQYLAPFSDNGGLKF